jgi:hypothetical protein
VTPAITACGNTLRPQQIQPDFHQITALGQAGNIDMAREIRAANTPNHPRVASEQGDFRVWHGGLMRTNSRFVKHLWRLAPRACIYFTKFFSGNRPFGWSSGGWIS